MPATRNPSGALMRHVHHDHPDYNRRHCANPTCGECAGEGVVSLLIGEEYCGFTCPVCLPDAEDIDFGELGAGDA